MKFFKRYAHSIDTAPFLKELAENDDLWTAQTGRQDKIKVQRETQTIFIRGAEPRNDVMTNENQVSLWTGKEKRLPICAKFMTDVAEKMGASLSRATIVRLQPRGNVYLHIDSGAYYHIRKRMHFVVQSKEGSILMSGGEIIRMQEGELWWFDNRQHHQAINNSDDWRIHFIFDVLPHKYKELAVNPVHIDDVSKAVDDIKKK